MNNNNKNKFEIAKFLKRTLSILTAFILAFNLIPYSPKSVMADTDLANKKIEILLSSDIGATVTADNYKQQLLENLIAKGYREENIRFIDSAETVRTGNLDMGWNVYDHLNYNETMTQDTTVYTSITPTSTAEVKDRDRHIYSLNGGKEMTFLGYGVPAYKDFAIYPSDSSDTKIVNFDISADKVDTHTLEGSGFLVNAGVDGSGILKGYLLFYNFTSSTSGTVYLLKLNTNASTMHDSADKLMLRNTQGGTLGNGYATVIGSGKPFNIDSTTKRINVNMIVSPGSIKCGYSQYSKDAGGNLVKGTETSLFNYTVATADQTNYNGFGPLVSYMSHGCASLTMFTFSNLSMKVDTSADNALKQSNWSSNGEGVSKFYVNITNNGLGTTANKESVLTSTIDKSVYYIGAGEKSSKAESDANSIQSYTAGSSYVETKPGTTDNNAINTIADIISAKASGEVINPLKVKDIVITNKDTATETRTVKVDDPTPGVDGPATFEIVYTDTTGNPAIKTSTAIDNGDGTLDIPVPQEALDKDWFIVRVPVATGNPEPTQAKLISNSDYVDPVVDFDIINQTTSKNVSSYDMKNGAITLAISDKSYSRSAVALSGNSTTSYKITAPNGSTVGTNGIVTLTSSAVSGDYAFTTTITVPNGGSQPDTIYKVTKKVTIINDNTAPTVTLLTTAMNGGAATANKSITIAMEDKESGLASYAIVVKGTNTAPDTASLTYTPVSASNSAYMELAYAIPYQYATNYIYVVAKDKSGNVTNKLIDSYTATTAMIALMAVNQAPTRSAMADVLDTYASALGLNLTDYNNLSDKSSIYDALLTPVFANTTQVKNAFDQAVALQKAAELTAAKTAAKKELTDKLAGLKEADYNSVNWSALLKAKSDGDNAINSATTIAAVTTAKVVAETAMDNIKTIEDIIADAVTEINDANTNETLDDALTKNETILGLDLTDYNELKDKSSVLSELLDQDFTTKEELKNALDKAVSDQKEREELAAAKDTAKTALADKLADLKEADYNSDNWTALLKAKTDGENAINSATTIAEVTAAKEAAETAIDDIKTIEEIIADAVTEINDTTTNKSLDDALTKNATILGLDLKEYKSLKDKSSVLSELLDQDFTTKEELKNALDKAVSDQTGREELAAAKEAAKKALADKLAGLKEADYNSDNWTALLKAKSDGDNAINSATTIAAVTAAKADAETAMDTIKTIEDIIADAVTEINNTTTNKTLDDALIKNATILGLDLKNYESLKDKSNVQSELLAKNFTTKEEIKTALDKAVSDQMKREALAGRIAIVDKFMSDNTSDNIDSTDADNLDKTLKEVSDILAQNTYLTKTQTDKLNEQKNNLQDYIDRLKNIQKGMQEIKQVTDTVSDTYITAKSKTDLLSSVDKINTLLNNEKNLTKVEKDSLLVSLDKLKKAIVIIEKKEESVKNVPKDSFVLILENQIDNLPNPDVATDSVIKSKENEIIDAKAAFDGLGDKKTQVSEKSVTKLDKLITRLAKINVKVDTSAAKTNVAVSGLGLLISKEDINTGLDVNLTLSVVNQTSQAPNKDTILLVAQNDVIGAYFDINIYKQIGTNDPTRLRELGTTVGITIDIPENIRGQQGYKIVRVHNGVPEVLPTTQSGNTLTFYTDKFSTYAIVYDAVQTLAPQTEVKADVPKTGEKNNSLLWAGIAATFAIGFLATRRRKSNRLK